MEHHEMLNIADGTSEHHSVISVTEPIDAIGSKTESEALIATTTAATLLPEHGGLVLVETSRGNLLLSVNGDMSTVSYAEADIEGRELLTSALPMTGILTQVQNSLGASQGTTLLINQPGSPTQATYESTVTELQTELQTDQLLTTKSPLTDTPVSAEQATVKKRRGGWTKGKRRKRQPDINIPRAPASGYLLYAIERRLEIKESNPEIPFAEVTKILGQEWSNMLADKKQKYLDESEIEKKRYKEELKSFQQSEAYQTILKKRKIKSGVRGDDGCWDTDENYTQLMSVDMEEDSLTDLYCRICDQYFSNHHNKKEHLMGRQHLQNMTGDIQDIEAKELESSTRPSTLSSSLATVPPDLGNDSNQSDGLGDKESAPLDISGFIQGFLQDNHERELETQEIRNALKNLQEDNLSLYKQINELKIYQNKLEDDCATNKAIAGSLTTQMDALKMVLALFGVINFQV